MTDPLVLRALVLVLVLGAPTWAQTAATQEARPAAAPRALPTATAEAVGLSAERLARIGPAMQKLVDDRRFAGISCLVARDGKVVYTRQFGTMDAAGETPVRPDTIFRIYSMSKPVVTVAALVLYEKGKLGLDDPVAKHLPELAGVEVLEDGETVPPKRPMTVRDLMRHTAGLTYGLFSNTEVDRRYRAVDVLAGAGTLTDMTRKLGKLPLLYHPGEQWHYSVAVDVLGRVVEVVSGKPLDRYLDETIFRPLGMDDTGFSVPPAKRARFAAMFGPAGGGKDGLRAVATRDDGRYAPPVSFLSGGGGLVSTADDYMRFALMLLGKGELGGVRILRRETVDLMASNQLPDALVPISIGLPMLGTGFGLGVSVRVEKLAGEPDGIVGEYGWSGAASTNFFISPAERLVGLTLTQYVPFSAELQRRFRPLVYAAIDAGAGSAESGSAESGPPESGPAESE